MALFTDDLWLDFLGLVIALTTAVVVYFKWAFGHWERKGIPTPQASIPFGNAADIFMQRGTIGDTFEKVYNEFKDGDHKYVGAYVCGSPILVPMDPELIKNIMTKDFNHFMDRGMFVNEKVDPLAAHLFSLPGSRWKNLRAKLTPTFTSGKMKTMFRTLVDCTAGLTDIVSASVDADGVDIKDVVGRYTTDVIGSCAFGLDCNSLKDPNTEFRVYGKRIFSPDVVTSLKLFCSFAAPRVLKLFNATVIEKEVRKFFMNVVRETIDYREKNAIKRKDFMNLLLQLKNKGKLEEDDDDDVDVPKGDVVVVDPAATLTVEQVAAQSFLFFAAGFETSSTTLTFCLYELVRNAHVQEKLRHEIVTVLNGHDGNVTYEAITDMKYMDNVISETLRKYPPVPLLNRICTKEYACPEMGVRIAEGQTIFISLQGMQRDARHYPQPERFDPDRFGDEAKRTRHPYAYLPFGEGPRVCIGLRFGMMQTKVALTVLLKNFRFTLNQKTRLPFVMDPKSFVMSVRDGVWLNAIRID